MEWLGYNGDDLNFQARFFFVLFYVVGSCLMNKQATAYGKGK
jgi:hypothetical protein